MSISKSGFRYYCRSCGRHYEITKDIMLCPNCKEDDIEGKPLKGVLEVKLPEQLKNSCTPFQKTDIFEYLPVEKEYFPSLPVGNTPLVKSSRLNAETEFSELYLKFDGTNPTGSYKDRASYLVSAFAKKNGLNEIVLASTGNAASSMAGIGAAAGQNIIVFLPASAPKAKLVQCLQYGARLIPVQGNYDNAFDLSLQYSALTGVLNRNTAYNPLTIEGKKTAAYEIINQLGCNADYVFVPTGDGVVLSGIIKGFNDLLYLGVIDKIPKVIAAQSENSLYIYDAFKTGTFNYSYKASTIADSISVDNARNGYSAVDDLHKVNGDAVIVSDEEILKAQQYISSRAGIFCEPSSATAAACFFKIMKVIPKDARVVLLLSGHGLKDVANAAKLIAIPDTYPNDIDFIMKSLSVEG